MADDVRVNRIINSDLTNLNVRQTGFETVDDADLGWKMYGGMNNSSELTKFLGKDKAARVTTFEATGDVTIISGSMVIDSLSLSTANATQVMYGDFAQAATFKWENSMLRVGSTNTPEYKIDIQSTTADHLRIINSNADAIGALFVLEKTSASPADNDSIAKIVFRGINDDPSVPEVDFVTVEAFSTDVSSDSADGKLLIKTMVAGTLTEMISIDAGTVAITHLPKVITTSTYTVLSSDELMVFDSDASAQTISLLAGVNGKFLSFANDGTSGNTVSIDPNGTEQFDKGGAGIAFSLYDGESIDAFFESTSNNWIIKG